MPGSLLPAGAQNSIIGKGNVTMYDEGKKTIDFEPIKPSDYLKRNPMWDGEVKGIIDEIKHNFNQGQMWVIPNDQLKRLNAMIDKHVNGLPNNS